MKKILVVFIVLLLVNCKGEKKGQQTVQPSQKTKAAVKVENPLLACKPEDLRSIYRKVYQLAPDRRFLMAISEIRKFYPSQKEETVRTDFSNGSWRIRYGNEELGTIPELADFPDFTNVLSAWAKNLNNKSPLKLVTTKDGEALEAQSRQISLSPHPIKILMKADEFWAHQKDGAVLVAAARATTHLAFQAYDSMEFSDLLDARALALITLSKVLTTYQMDREESLLAYTMIYTKHAEHLASLLPSQDAVRMFLNDVDLTAIASTKSASEEVRFLRMMQLSKQPYTKIWMDTQKKLFPEDSSLAILKTGLSLPRQKQMENEHLDNLPYEVPPAVISELRGLEKASVDKINELSQFETLIDALYKNDSEVFSNADVIASFYNSFFYSSFSKRNLSPGKGRQEVSVEFDRFISLFQMATKGNPKVDSFIDQTRTLKHLQGAAGYPLYALINTLSWDSPNIPTLCRVLSSIYDARPYHRTTMAWLYKWKLYDRNHAEELYSSILKIVSPLRYNDSIVDPAVYLGEVELLKKILHSAECDDRCASNILWNWDYSDEFHNKEIEAEYDWQIKENPHSWQLTNVYVDFLRKVKKYPKACKIVEDWLRNNTDPNHVGYIHAHARLAHGYYLLGEYQKSLDAVKENTPSWIAERESALSLSKLGKKDEAVKLAKSSQKVASEDFEGLLALVQILWEAGKHKEAASTLQGFVYPYSDWCDRVSESFHRAFQNASPAEVHNAIDALRAAHFTGWRLTCLPLAFAKEHQYEMAFEIQSYIMPPASADENIMMDSYTYLKEWKGEKEAIQWIKKMVPPNKLNPLSYKALAKGEYNLLWDVIENPYYKDRPHFVWLFRAAASVKMGTKNDPHYQEVYKHFSPAGKDPYYLMGRYLMGLSTDEDMLKIAADPQRRSDICYLFGLKAESEARIKDASVWYVISMETGTPSSFGSGLSRVTISSWPMLGFWAVNLPKPETEVAKKL